jgi:hypothetical protein
MAVSRALSRCPWIALVATLAALLTGDGRSADAGTTPGRMAQMRRAGCCCRTLPVGGCCCEPAATPAVSNAITRTKQEIEVSSLSHRPARLDPTRPGSTCQCRSNDPVAPTPQPDERGEDRGTDHVRAAIGGWSIQDEIAPTPVRRPVVSRTRPPRSLLDLRTTRLLI